MPTCDHGRKGPCGLCADSAFRKVLRPSSRQITLSRGSGNEQQPLWEIPNSTALFYIPLGVLVPPGVGVELNLPRATSQARLFSWQTFPANLYVEMRGVREIDTMIFAGTPFFGVSEQARVTLVEEATLIRLAAQPAVRV